MGRSARSTAAPPTSSPGRTDEKAQLDDHAYRALLVPPLPKWQRRLYDYAGYAFLAVGFLLLVLILVGTFA